MSAKITASSLFVRHYLVVKSSRIVFYESSVGFGAKRFKFSQIDHILMSAKDVLSFQVGREVFSIPMNPEKAKHQLALMLFVRGVQESLGGAQPQA